ncbi:MAG TPA: serine/threonine-protein kinase, partial [Polyangiaceae bacterium]|nr:serine/threonine-protein kinase [Polyangiaceae bacterium]
MAQRYEILARLGAGGMGLVYRARDRKLGEDVALKVLQPERLHDPAMLVGLHREVKLARRITHTNVCRVYDVGEDGQTIFLTMELVEGRTLRALLKAGPLAPDRALTMLQQVVDGLAAVHAQGVIHRDLKPENVLVRAASGEAVVADFGLALVPLGDQASADVAGTPAYMSPEQLRGEALDARSDIFSLGLLAYEMLTGCLPFGGGSSVTKNRGVFHARPDRLQVATLPPQFVRALDKVLARAMAQNPAERFASAAEFGAALAAARVQHSRPGLSDLADETARRTGGWLRRRRLNRWMTFALAGALPAVGALVAVNTRSGPEDPRPAIAVAPLENLTGDPAWNGLAQGAVEAIRTGLRTIPQVRLVDAPRAEARLLGGRGGGGATWVVAGSVQRVGAGLHLEVQLRAAGGAAVGEPIEIDGDPADPSSLPKTLRSRALGEV